MLLTLQQMVKMYSSNLESERSREKQDGEFWLSDYFTTIKYDAGEQLKMTYRYADDGCGHEVAYLIIEGEDFKYTKHIFANRNSTDNNWRLRYPDTHILYYDRRPRLWVETTQHPHVPDCLECDEDVRETAEAKLALLVLRYA